MAYVKAKGCDGVEPDNVDGYSQSKHPTGFGSNYDSTDQIEFNKWIAQTVLPFPIYTN